MRPTYMRSLLHPALLSGSFLALLGSPLMADELTAVSKVDAVTVFPQGAEVSRIAKLSIPKGTHTVILSDIPADAVSSSIRVEGLATGKLEIGSVDSRRLMVPRSDEQQAASERRRIEDEIEALRDQRTAPEADLQAAETQKNLIANLAQLPTRPPSPQGTERSEDWDSVLSTIASASARAQRLQLDAQLRLRALDRRIEDLEKQLASLAPAEEERTEIRVHVEAIAAVDADLVIRYQVANASWTALYDARLTTGDKVNAPSLVLLRRAEIQQNTGEAWDNIALALSTTRPSASAAAPELYPMTVDFEPPPEMRPMAGAPAPMTEGMLRKRAMQAEPGMDMAAETAEAEPVVAAVAPKQASVMVAPFQATFAVAGRVAIPNTGEPKRVALASDTLEPKVGVKTVPKADASAYLYTKFTLPAGTPVLPGPVSLFRDGTFVGTASLPLLSPGEEHEMGFGTDDLVRVKHAVLEEKRGETGLISTSRTDSRNFKLTIKNLHERQISVRVLDQLPVSNNQDIKVEQTSKRAPTTANVDDRRGVLAWDFDLEPDQEQVLEFGYRVTWPSGRSIIYR